MPRTINADGRTITVPDDATPEEINEIVGPGPKPSVGSILSSAGTPAMSERDKLTRTQYIDPKAPAFSWKEAEKATGNIGAGFLTPILHPIDTAIGMGRMTPVVAALEAAQGKPTAYQEMGEEFVKHPLETIETGIGNAAAFGGAGEVAGEVAPRVARAIPKVAQDTLGKVTGTGPKSIGSLVKDTQTGQAAADSFSKVRAAIETGREKALKIGNEKYNAVNTALNPIQADPEFMQGALSDALESLKGSKTEPTILRQMTAKLQRGDAFTYEDLQGDYSRLGREISKGTLPGDEYHAYDQLHEAIGEEMQRIADSEGVGPQLTEARDYWRRMKQTFGKPLPQNDAATSTLHSLAPDMAQQDSIANRIRLLGSFDPEIPKAFDAMQKAREAAKDVPKPAAGETKKLDTEDVRQHKVKKLAEGTERVRKVGRKIVNYGVGLKALWDAYHLNVGSAASDVALGYGGYKTADAFARLLEKPSIVEMLTKPTDADIAQIPPELRGPNLKPILDAAKAKGIKVDPRLYAVAGAAAPKKRVGDILPKVQ